MRDGQIPARPRVRLGFVLALTVCGIVVIGSLLGALSLYAAWRTPAHVYAKDFDANMAQSQPEIWPVVKADPGLRRLMLERTQAAFLRGGWPASSTVFWRIVDARLSAFAGNDTTLACHAAWTDVYRALLPNPHACRLIETKGLDALPNGLAAAEIERATRLCKDAAAEGGELRSLPNPPGHGNWDEHQKLRSLTMNAPRPLSASEVAALDHPDAADDATWCHAKVGLGDNLLAQPHDAAARDMRFEFASEEDEGFDPSKSAVAVRTEPPRDLTCAPAGRVFTLSMYGRNGRPITWTSLGRRGWDCALQSSASGLRGAWTNLDDTGDNALALLWPLSVGKSADCGCGHDGSDVYRVVSHDRYWLPFGWVQAYAIEEDISAWNGDRLYSTTKYWSPELGFVIGQHTLVTRGGWPDGVAPDWQVVAKDGGAG